MPKALSRRAQSFLFQHCTYMHRLEQVHAPTHNLKLRMPKAVSRSPQLFIFQHSVPSFLLALRFLSQHSACVHRLKYFHVLEHTVYSTHAKSPLLHCFLSTAHVYVDSNMFMRSNILCTVHMPKALSHRAPLFLSQHSTCERRLDLDTYMCLNLLL
jgi:hypothetical protein